MTTSTAPEAQPKTARHRSYLMCSPEHFDVSYTINPWMDPDRDVDTKLAVQQWRSLHDTFVRLGHDVQLIDPIDGLPDMVYAANGGLVIDSIAWGANFLHDQRKAEGPLYLERLRQAGYDARVPEAINEGEGDFLLVGQTIFAGTGFRSEVASHLEAQEVFGRPVVSLQLVDPRFYHLDTALTVLDDSTIAYLPAAFSPGSQGVLRRMYPDAILATEADAQVFGLNAVSDGLHVVVAEQTTTFQDQLRERGFEPIPLDLSVLLRGGGGIKCCTLELRNA